MKESHPIIYDLSCQVRRSELCPAKVNIIREATGDPTGRTAVYSELAEHFVQAKFLEQDAAATVAEAFGRHGDIENICPIRPTMNNNIVRRSVLGLLRGGFHRVTGRQNP